MQGTSALIRFFVIFVLSTGLLYLYRLFAIRHKIIDIPNHRSSHLEVTPRGGGLIFIFTWLSGLLYSLFNHELSYTVYQSFFYPVLLIAVVSYIDDYFDISRMTRFVVHVLASAIAIFIIYGFELREAFIPNMLIIGTLVFFSSWSINLFNFMDGLDGFAAVQALFIFVVTGLLLYYENDDDLAYLSLLLAFSVLGFLVWNWPKAKIFMGDVGSTSLGLLIVIFSCSAYKRDTLSPLIYLILYLPFVFDATITMLRRMLNGEKWYHAHKSHAYQRLHAAGWSHQGVLFGLIGLGISNTMLVLLAFIFPRFELTSLCIEIALLMIIYFNIEKAYPMRGKTELSQT